MDSTYNLNGGYKPTLKRFADLDGPDFFPTPEWATLALMDSENFEGLIWEPACGDGSMARVLASKGNEVIATDLYDRGFGPVDCAGGQPLIKKRLMNKVYNLLPKLLSWARQRGSAVRRRQRIKTYSRASAALATARIKLNAAR